MFQVTGTLGTTTVSRTFDTQAAADGFRFLLEQHGWVVQVKS